MEYENVLQACKKAKANQNAIAFATNDEQNIILKIICNSLKQNEDIILAENKKDIEYSRQKGKPAHFIDRLTLTSKKIDDIVSGVNELMDLVNPVGEILDEKIVKSGLKIKKVRVPLGVIAMIYEARPNVTVDAIALCVKSCNAVVLRGSSETINSNKEIVRVIKQAIQKAGFNSEFIQLVEDTTRDGVNFLMQQKDYIDTLIPRGSAALIKNAVENSSIPVIETGAGNCHIFVEKTADLEMATKIILNAKTSKPSVCNACESLVIDSSIAEKYLPMLEKSLKESKVDFCGCQKTVEILKGCKLATEEDFYAEYLDYMISIKVVDSVEQAIEHINAHSTKHSDAIISNDNASIEKFMNEIDSACIYVNASTRFSDGFEFGLGAEIGISTQKLHARGPMGIKEMTTHKYLIFGEGQIR